VCIAFYLQRPDPTGRRQRVTIEAVTYSQNPPQQPRSPFTPIPPVPSTTTIKEPRKGGGVGLGSPCGIWNSRLIKPCSDHNPSPLPSPTSSPPPAPPTPRFDITIRRATVLIWHSPLMLNLPSALAPPPRPCPSPSSTMPVMAYPNISPDPGVFTQLSPNFLFVRVPRQFTFGAVQLLLNLWFCLPRLLWLGTSSNAHISLRVDNGWLVASVGNLLLMPRKMDTP